MTEWFCGVNETDPSVVKTLGVTASGGCVAFHFWYFSIIGFKSEILRAVLRKGVDNNSFAEGR
jgi:hypothetical protein